MSSDVEARLRRAEQAVRLLGTLLRTTIPQQLAEQRQTVLSGGLGWGSTYTGGDDGVFQLTQCATGMSGDAEIVDGLYGTCRASWNGVAWVGCQEVTYAPTNTTVGLQYTITPNPDGSGNATLELEYQSVDGSAFSNPVGSTCGDGGNTHVLTNGTAAGCDPPSLGFQVAWAAVGGFNFPGSICVLYPRTGTPIAVIIQA